MQLLQSGHSCASRYLPYLWSLPQPADNLEPYCTEAVLIDRFHATPVDEADRKAIHRIAARYGAQL